ncbi:hypothetical protein Tco_0218059 [Tanacetum coccineum]
MANLKFADTHNMVAFLSKPEESDGFEQIVDFLNAHPIKYALTVNPTIYISCIEQFWSTVKAKTINGEVQLHALVDGKKIIITESTVRRDLQLEIAEGKEFSGRVTPLFQTMVMMQSIRVGDSLVRAATTASSLEAEQDSGNITKTRSKETPNESSSQRTNSGCGPKCQKTMRDTIAQTRFENVSKHSNDSLLARGNTLQSDDDRLKLNELMELCTNLQKRVLDLEKTKTTQANEIASLKRSLKRRVKKHEKKNSVQDDADKEMFDVDALNGEEVFVAGQNENVVEEVVDAAQVSTAATTVTITTEEITLAQALEALKTSKPKVKGIVFQEPGKSTTTTTISSQQSQDKGKGIMIEEPVKPMKKKVQIMLDEEVALKLQAEFDEEERLAREKAKKEKEANIALIEEWDDIQAKIDVDYQLAERLQAQEQEELSNAEKATLFQQLLEKRRKHFAAKRSEEKRNKPPTKAHQKKIMCTYLKNMERYKLKDLKDKEFDSIQEMFDRAFKRVNTFEDFRTELVEGKEKRAGTELIQENAKKQKVKDDKETVELKQCLEIIPDEEEVTIDVVPLAVKSSSIVG